MSIEYKMSVAAHELDYGKTYRLGNGKPFTVTSESSVGAPLPNGIQRYYYDTQDRKGVITKAGEMYTLVNGGGRRRKSRKARRAQKKRTRRSRS
jgi:hypothetical protein